MRRQIMLLGTQIIDNKHRTIELLPEDEFFADDESIRVAFFIDQDNKYVIIPDATAEHVWEEWINQFQ